MLERDSLIFHGAYVQEESYATKIAASRRKATRLRQRSERIGRRFPCLNPFVAGTLNSRFSLVLQPNSPSSHGIELELTAVSRIAWFLIPLVAPIGRNPYVSMLAAIFGQPDRHLPMRQLSLQEPSGLCGRRTPNLTVMGRPAWRMPFSKPDRRFAHDSLPSQELEPLINPARSRLAGVPVSSVLFVVVAR